MCAEFVGRPWGRPSEVADAGAPGRSGGSSRLIHLPLTPRRGTRSGRVSLEKGDADGSAGARSRLDPDGTQPPPQNPGSEIFWPRASLSAPPTARLSPRGGPAAERVPTTVPWTGPAHIFSVLYGGVVLSASARLSRRGMRASASRPGNALSGKVFCAGREGWEDDIRRGK